MIEIHDLTHIARMIREAAFVFGIPSEQFYEKYSCDKREHATQHRTTQNANQSSPSAHFQLIDHQAK